MPRSSFWSACIDTAWQALGIKHRLSPPRYPQTNGMVERFSHSPQKALNHSSPVQALTQWLSDEPELFVERVSKKTGPDT